ncbi:ferric reductase-like transmembrane domain-containing protein [uncultured Adlercreutzia sp.]|uniref:ferric reductase-like transmembrane domain-containing protein n=1 Tax=uncultured Adlercreutzia sp. TaxID=875803 RepID=UPI00266DD500|nr:ferric reductase-like transmembrane domain-containing protein [uncultured Adlercreutzia sp.]
MRFVVALVLSFALVWLCAKPLKRCPAPFYLGAVALVGLYLWGTGANVRGEAWSYFQPLMQRCALAFLLFSIVMFVGVLGERNPLRVHLMPIRRQLSILACIFACGHIAFYAASYVPRLTSAFSGNLAFSLGLAALITALMAVLWATSAQRVKHTMKAASWKRVQRLAYPFYVLTYVHLALLLMPSAMAGNNVAVLSIAVYSIVMGAYVVLRLRKAAADRLAEPAAAASDLDLEAAPA